MLFRQDPHEYGQRTSKFLKNMDDEDFLLELNRILHDANISTGASESHPEDLPFIYIVGAPRSGTTLLSQILSHCFPVGYINNLIARFWTRPSVGIRLSRILLGDNIRERISFVSSYGTTSEIWGPHEFGYFWRQWLKLDLAPTHHLTADFLAGVDGKGLKNALENEILASFNAPVVYKNIICGFQASFLTEIHPKSLFIHIKRNPYITAASILNARYSRFGSYETWWSLKPSSWPFNIPNDMGAEVVTQVYECRKEMDEELARPNVKALQVSYEDLCTKPNQVLETICSTIGELGCTIHPIISEYPCFQISEGPRLPAAFEQKMKETISHLNWQLP